MVLEKKFTLLSGRSVKVIAKTKSLTDKVKPEIEVLIKEPKEEDFHPSIGLSHLKYWKLKKLGSRQIKSLQIQYNGISEKQLRKVVTEFESL